MFAIKSLYGANLWKDKRELNEIWYICRRPSKEVQSGKTETLSQEITYYFPSYFLQQLTCPEHIHKSIKDK